MMNLERVPTLDECLGGKPYRYSSTSLLRL
jgi:hypothetical protein